mgnify:CR=1 FL=1
MSIPNVLANRYAGADLAQLWSPEHKIVLERQLWIAVLKAQKDLGIEVPDGVVEAYESVVDKVDLDSIAARERVTRHDVKARIEEFCALAGHEHIHKGMTSRDLTENVEQLQVKASLEFVRDRVVATLARLARLASEHEALVMAGRSHNVAAQATTLGKRFANAGEELLELDDVSVGEASLHGLYAVPAAHAADGVGDLHFAIVPPGGISCQPPTGVPAPARCGSRSRSSLATSRTRRPILSRTATSKAWTSIPLLS